MSEISFINTGFCAAGTHTTIAAMLNGTREIGKYRVHIDDLREKPTDAELAAALLVILRGVITTATSRAEAKTKADALRVTF